MCKIKLMCKHCKTIHVVKKDDEAPKQAIAMWSNFCPKCDGFMSTYYEEGYYMIVSDVPRELMYGLNPNQIELFK